MEQIIQVYVPFPSQETAKSVSQEIIENKLAACSNIIEGSSLFTWDGTLEEQVEYVVFFKTVINLQSEIVAAIEYIHPYDVPCIIVKKVLANTSYYKWMLSVLA